MKKVVLLGIFLAVASNSLMADAHSDLPRPLSPSLAVLGSAALAAVSGGLVKVAGEYALNYFDLLKGNTGIVSTVAACAVAGCAALISWKYLSLLTSSGHMRSARAIVADIAEGKTLCPAAVFVCLQGVGTNADSFSDFVVRFYAARGVGPDARPAARQGDTPSAEFMLYDLCDRLREARRHCAIAGNGALPVEKEMISMLDGYISLVQAAQPLVRYKSLTRAVSDVMAGERFMLYDLSGCRVFELMSQAGGNAQAFVELMAKPLATHEDNYLKAADVLVELHAHIEAATTFLTEMKKEQNAPCSPQVLDDHCKILAERRAVVENALLVVRSHSTFKHQEEMKRIKACEDAAHAAECAANRAANAANRAADEARWARFLDSFKTTHRYVTIKGKRH